MTKVCTKCGAEKGLGEFEPWMSWNNYGIYKIGGEKKWSIDHIVPQSYYNYETMGCESFKQCWALENLRPLDSVENSIKGDRLG